MLLVLDLLLGVGLSSLEWSLLVGVTQSRRWPLLPGGSAPSHCLPPPFSLAWNQGHPLFHLHVSRLLVAHARSLSILFGSLAFH